MEEKEIPMDMEDVICNEEFLDPELEKAYTNAEFDELVDYFIAIEKKLKIDDPRPRMSFITPEIERKAKEYALYVNSILDEFDGSIISDGERR